MEIYVKVNLWDIKNLLIYLNKFYWKVRNYGKIIANLAKDLDYIYFKAQPKQDCPNEIEYVLPIDEIDQNFNLQLVHNLLEYINKQKNDNKEVKK